MLSVQRAVSCGVLDWSESAPQGGLPARANTGCHMTRRGRLTNLSRSASPSRPPPFLLRSLCACLSFSPFSLICPLVALCSHRLLVCARIGFSLAVASFPLVFRPMPTVLKFVHRLISSLSQSPLGVMRPVALTHGQFHAYMMLILLRATTLVPLSSAWICYMICEGHR